MVKRSKAAKSKRGAFAAPETLVASLPELSTLTELPRFSQLEASAAQLAAFEQAHAADTDLELACVVRLDRGFPALALADGVIRAEFSASLSKADDGRVAVGDWVCVRRPKTHDMGIIEQILPRRNEVTRWRGAARGKLQILAANVDLVLAVHPLGETEIDCARIARSVVLARDCGLPCVVVLTKSDRAVSHLEQDLASFREFFSDDVAQVSTRADDATGIEQVRDLVPKGKIAIVLGATGAGKSTLLNALVGHELLETGEVRASDDSGRHTTVTRRMVSIPGAGIIVDEPGFRNLLVCGHEQGLRQTFPELAEAAQHCRFRDCTHTHEPGCALQELREAGEVSERKLQAYLSLASEMRIARDSLDPDVVL